MRSLLALTLCAILSTASAAESYEVLYDDTATAAELNLPFVRVHNFVARLHPAIPANQIIVDLIDDDVYQVTIVLSKSTKYLTVKLIGGGDA